MMQTVIDKDIQPGLLGSYFKMLVNRFFKILPMRESGEKSVPEYIRSLQNELVGVQNLVSGMENDPSIITLLAILEFLHDTPDCTIKETKREVFRAISICNKLNAAYMGGDTHE